jgi:hypothetical protein
VNFSVFHDEGDFLQDGDVAERIALDGDELGALAGLEGAKLTGDAEQTGSVYVFPAILFFKFGGLSTCSCPACNEHEMRTYSVVRRRKLLLL